MTSYVFFGYLIIISFSFGCHENKKDSYEEFKAEQYSDSLSGKHEGNKKILKKEWDTVLTREIIEMCKTDQKYRSGDIKYFELNYNLQSCIDSLNTKRLIEIIKAYGYPTAERLKKKANTAIILMHAPEFYFPELKKIIVQENKEGYISEYENELLLWHLNGRIGKGP